MGFLRAVQGVSVWVLLFCACVSGQATLRFNAIPAGLEPTPFTISLTGAISSGLAADERLWVHLPGFGGGYNNLGPFPGDASVTLGNTGGAAPTLRSAEWDSHREILRITTSGGTVTTITVGMSSNDAGVGPLPPRGGIDGSWTNFAWVRRYTNCGGTEPVVCSAPTTETTFTAAQRFATGFGKLPSKMIGATGGVVLPAFTIARAEGSTNSQGLSNCITVTFATSVTMQAVANNGIFLTISGLVSNNLADQDNLPIYRNRANCQAATNAIGDSVILASERKFRGQEGTLTLQYNAGQQIVAHEENVITFALNNPSTVQSSLAISIAATGRACLQDYKCPDDDTVLTTVSPRAIDSSMILETRAPFFSTKKIFQQTSDPGVDSVIFVTLAPSEDITGSSTVTLSGLCGSAFNANQIALISTTAGSTFQGSSLGNPVDALAVNGALNGANHEWDYTTGTLKIALSATGMTAGTQYAFGFIWRLSDTANSACTATINAGSRFVSEPLENVGMTFGTILSPQFTTLRIGQATTRPGVTNYICVTLQSNANFGSENDDEGNFQPGVITLSGLTGTNAATNPSATIFRCPNGVNANGQLTVDGFVWNANDAATRNVWTTLPSAGGQRMFNVPNEEGTGNDFSWDAANARATLTIDSGFTFQSGTQYVFALNLENGLSEQDCRTVTLSATSGQWTQTGVSLVAPTVARALQDPTETGDACPLKIYARKFLVNAMAQQIPLAEEDNTFTVTLKPNVDLTSDATAVTSTITISGLTNTLTSLTEIATMAVPGTFYPRFSSVSFDSTTGVMRALLSTGSCTNPPTMVLLANGASQNTCMKAGFTYGFSFRLKNPLVAQNPPNVQIGAVFASGTMPMTAVTAPSDPMKQVLRIIPATNIMKTYSIGQTNTIPGQKNAICVTLASWVGLEDNTEGVGNQFTTVTITGLGSQWKTSTQDQNLWHPDTSGDFGNLPLTSDTTIGAPQRNRDPATKIGTQAWSTVASGRADSRVRYSSEDGTVTFVMNNLVRETEYPFCFLMTNPDSVSTCKTVGLQVSSPGRQTSTYTMSAAAGDGCVGVVGDKSFPMTALRSATNVANAEPTLILDFSPNFGLTGGEVIELSGMSSYVPVGGDSSEDRDVQLFVSRNGRWDSTTFLSTGRWIVSTGALRLTLQAASSILVPDNQRFCTTTPVPTNVNVWRNNAPNAGGCRVNSVTNNFEIMFDLQNKAAAQAAPTISIAAAPGANQLSSPEFPPIGIDTGMNAGASGATVSLSSGRRNEAQNLILTLTTRSHIYGGETIVVDLPHYTATSSGELFGVTSTGSDAFMTFPSATDADGSNAAMGRAFFTEGYVNAGLTANARSGRTGQGLDGFFMLAANDPAGSVNDRMHKPWFADPRPLYMGSMARSTFARASPAPYTNVSDIAQTLAFSFTKADGSHYTANEILANPRYRVFMGANNLAGMVVTCGQEERVVLDHATTMSPYTVHLFIEREMTGSVASCSLNYKQHVGAYTGMRGMVGNKEVLFKQGAGSLYFVSDESGNAPTYLELQQKPYTVYSRLELVAKHGANVPEGTQITITVPGLIFPNDPGVAVTPDTTETIADKTTVSMALISPLAGATTLAAGQASGNYNIELTEWRPYIGAAAYNGEFLASLNGLYVDFFGAMSMEGMGRTTSAREVEFDPQYYSATNASSWNYVRLASGNTLSDTAISEKYAGSKLIMGMSGTPNIRAVQLRVAVQMSALQSGEQTVWFLGPSDSVFSPDVRNMSAPGGFRASRTTIEPLGVLGKGFADGTFYSAGSSDSTGRNVDLIAASSNVYNLGSVGDMIGGDIMQNVAMRSSGLMYLPVGGDRDSSFIYQAPFPITGQTDYSSTTRTEPTLTYDTGTQHPPQVFGANIRAMVMLMQPEVVNNGGVVPGPGGDTPAPPGPGDGGGGGGGGGGGDTPAPDPCAGVTIPDITVTADTDLAALNEQYSLCGYNLVSCSDATTDGGIGCWQTAPRGGRLDSIGEVGSDDVAMAIGATGLTTASIKSKILRVTGSNNLRILLRFIFSVTEQTNTGTTIENVDSTTRRRRLLQSCPDGQEYRVVKLGEPVANSCSICEATCTSPAECEVGAGEWTTMLIDSSICETAANNNNNNDDDDDDDTGVIVGSVVGGTLGLLTLLALCYMANKNGQQNNARPKLAPVYLPEEYPVLPLEYQPNPGMELAPPPQPLYLTNEATPPIYSSQPGGQYETYTGTAAQLARGSAVPQMPASVVYPGSSYPIPMGGPAYPAPASAAPMMPMAGNQIPMYGI